MREREREREIESQIGLVDKFVTSNIKSIAYIKYR